ncbi:MAG TPA: hypothetical protein ENI37_04140 [Chloroflexi bacterium]|nr:hypothetical protein [Chloroflexota bacterium]
MAMGLREAAVGRAVSPPHSKGCVGQAVSPPHSKGYVGQAVSPPHSKGCVGQAVSPPHSKGCVGQAVSLPHSKGCVGQAVSLPHSKGCVGQAVSLPHSKGYVGQAVSLPHSKGCVGQAVSPPHSKGCVGQAVSPPHSKGCVGQAVSPSHSKGYVGQAVSPPHSKGYVGQAVSPPHSKGYVGQAVSPPHSKGCVGQAVSPPHSKGCVGQAVSPPHSKGYVGQAVSPPYTGKVIIALSLVLLIAASMAAADTVYAQEPPPICFWSAQGPVAVERAVEVGAAAPDPEGLLASLLAGPTPQERAQGIWSAIPEGTTLEGLDVRPGGTVVVRLGMPFEWLRDLDHETSEVIVHQIGSTLEPLGWRDLRVETWDPIADEFVPLAAFLPPIPLPRKETSALPPTPFRSPHGEREGGEVTLSGQPPIPGQGQPQGGLSNKTVYVSAGHGWQWNGYGWRTQRPPYPNPPYVGPIIEDHNNAEAVNQYLLQYLWNAGAMVWPVRERDMNGVERVADNDGYAGYAEEGMWETGSLTGYDPNVPGTYRYTTTVVGTATATATWAMDLPADGRYAVYVWYRPGSDRAPDARYTVHHAGGQTTVIVNQRHHGLTWRYLGTYGFRGGEQARVTLTNQSAVSGALVIADAVRFGGGTFDSLSGIQTSAPYPPNKPWWEVATFYYAQRMGVDPDDYPDFNDVIARPIYARWEHAGTGDDAVYVSWHTNGYSGYQWDYSGTVSYIHNGTGNPVTPGSADLRNVVHNELVHDIRAGWDSGWVDRGLRSANLGELRELWDEDPTVRMPGALIEVAYHDHPNDTDALKDPRFNMLAARAIYQGIVKYFEQRDGVDLTLLPEPPTHLAVQNAGGGEVRVSWQPSPTDTAGLLGDPATGYRVYTSTDGLGWSDGIPVASTAYTLTDLSPGQLIFVRVTATNAGGESFPTETLAARVGQADSLSRILLVNGFDRLNRFAIVPETDPVEGYNMRMLLDQMNRYDYSIHHGQVISYFFDSTSNEAVESGLVDLSEYRVVDWILGEESSSDATLSAAERSALANYLDSGGALFISGAELGWDLDDQGRDPVFYNTYLRADYAGDDAGTYEVVPTAGGIFDGLGSFRFDAPGEYDADYPDQLTPLYGSTAALVYQGGAGGTAAVQYENGCQRLVNFGFPFETIRPDSRAAVMARVMDFLDECLAQGPETVISNPEDGGIYWSEPPSFSGLASAVAGVQRVEASLQRMSDGFYWDGTSWDEHTQWHTATGTTSWSFTMPLTLAVGSYTAQARAWDTEGISDTTPAEAGFRFVVLDRSAFLPLVLQQYGEAPPPCSDIIVNGGFESDAGWEVLATSYPAGYTTTPTHTGLRSMRIGIPAGLPGGGKRTYSAVAQTLTLPAGHSATLYYWVYPIYEDADDGDLQYVWLVDGYGTTHILSTARENLAAWVERELDLSAFAGQTVSLRFSVRNDGNDDTAVTYLDDVRVEVCPP